jgi:hypothetical protein
VVEAVAMSPMCVVIAASAESSVIGSNEVTVALRSSAAGGILGSARLSARKIASKRPRSSVSAKRR